MAEPVDNTPELDDVSLVENDIAQPTDVEEPSVTADTPQDGADTQEEATDEEQAPSEGDQPPAEEAKSEPDATSQREHNERMARQRIIDRQRTREQIAQQIDQAYAPKSADELVEEGFKPEKAEIEALRQEVQFTQEKTRIAELNANMRAEAVEVFSDFPVFNPGSPQYDPQFTQMVEQSYKQTARLTTDDNGIIVNAEVPLYDYYQQMATIYNRGTSRGAQQGQRQVQDMMARTENPGGSSSTSGPAPGSLEEMEARYGDVVIT